MALQLLKRMSLEPPLLNLIEIHTLLLSIFHRNVGPSVPSEADLPENGLGKCNEIDNDHDESE